MFVKVKIKKDFKAKADENQYVVLTSANLS